MDFQRLFKRKAEDPAPSIGGDKTRENLNEREVLVREGELLDGPAPASLLWESVGGALRVKADKIAGILEGRTRIRAEVLQELYPGLFENAPNPGTEYQIPLRAIINQLEDLFAVTCPEESVLEDFDTPFGQLAREDEAKFRDPEPNRREDQTMTGPIRLDLSSPDSTPMGKEQDQNAGQSMATNAIRPDQRAGDSLIKRRSDSNGLDSIQKETASRDPGPLKMGLDMEKTSGEPPVAFESSAQTECRKNYEHPKPGVAELPPVTELRTVISESPTSAYGNQLFGKPGLRRDGLEYLQELYLTDDSLDGSKVADLILRLPRVAGVVIMLSDGAALGGGLGGGISEALLSLAPEFVQHL